MGRGASGRVAPLTDGDDGAGAAMAERAAAPRKRSSAASASTSTPWRGGSARTGGEDSPCDITRGLFAGEVGSPRLLRLFEKLGIPTTRFIPGHSLETFPAQMRAVAEAGHEIALHGYSHEDPVAMTPAQEEAVLRKCIGWRRR